MARTFDASEFVAEHVATAKDVTNGKAKVCTFKGCACGNVPLMLDAFYRDKSMKDGRSPWCKIAERTYNASYRSSLTKVKAPKKASIPTPKGVKTFEAGMSGVRVARGKNNVAPAAPARTRKARTSRARAKK